MTAGDGGRSSTPAGFAEPSQILIHRSNCSKQATARVSGGFEVPTKLFLEKRGKRLVRLYMARVRRGRVLRVHAHGQWWESARNRRADARIATL